MLIRHALLACAAGLLTACAAGPAQDSIEVTWDHNVAIDVSRYRTYRWSESANSYARAFEADGERAVQMQDALRAAVVRSLAEKGYTQVFDATPDFLVSYHVAVFESLRPGLTDEQRHRAREEALRASAESPTRNIDVAIEPETVRRATLVLRFEDAASRKFAWSGTASGQASTFRAGRRGMEIAVRRIIEHFPP